MADPKLFNLRRMVISRDHKIFAVFALFFGAFVGRAILQSTSAAVTLGIGTGFRLVYLLFVKYPFMSRFDGICYRIHRLYMRIPCYVDTITTHICTSLVAHTILPGSRSVLTMLPYTAFSSRSAGSSSPPRSAPPRPTAPSRAARPAHKPTAIVLTHSLTNTTKNDTRTRGWHTVH
jgi:hypothetical protein